jgi:hypothetical protein
MQLEQHEQAIRAAEMHLIMYEIMYERLSDRFKLAGHVRLSTQPMYDIERSATARMFMRRPSSPNEIWPHLRFRI